MRRAWVLLAVTALSCGKAMITADEACSDLATVQCMKRSSCTDGAGITRMFGDMATCLAREKLSCLDALAAPATGQSPAAIEKCVAAFAGYSCTDFGDNNPPADCVPAGGRAAGGVCTFNGQCDSAYCSRTTTTVCGSCAAPPALGASCAESPCDHGQVCIADDTGSVCQVRSGLNGACGPSDPCGAGLSCAGNTANTLGTCQPALTTPGAPCGGALPGCDNAIGLHCGGPANTGKSCLLTTFVTDGMPCGTMGDGSFAECARGGCYTTSGAIEAGQQGACKADALDGGPCDTLLGPGCTPPARCVVSNGTAGTCTIPLAATCG